MRPQYIEPPGPSATVIGAMQPPRVRRFLSELEHPRDFAAHIGPNWFASVMGTGIVANAAALLPVHIAGLHAFAIGVWVFAAVLLLALLSVTALHWLAHRENALGHHNDAAMAPFYGAPPMAMLTVGTGALLVGKSIIGIGPAVRVDEILWTLGTLTGLVSMIAVPYLMFTRHNLEVKNTLATWLMPIVPPMVSAAAGAGLIAHLPAGQDRLTMLLACYSLFGMSLVASVVVITLLWGRLAYHGVGPARTVPTLWIVLGPLGQSITATNLLGHASAHVIPAPYAPALSAFGVIYGIPVFGFAMAWLVVAGLITLATVRQGMPFSLTWWSFTFPVGTVVTGTSELALHTHAHVLVWASVALYGLLLSAWVTAATRTAHGAFMGRLLLPAPSPQAPPQVQASRVLV